LSGGDTEQKAFLPRISRRTRIGLGRTLTRRRRDGKTQETRRNSARAESLFTTDFAEDPDKGLGRTNAKALRREAARKKKGAGILNRR